MGRKLTVKVYADMDIENPADATGAWTPYSFSRRHRNFMTAPPKDLKRKLKAGLAFRLAYFEHGRCQWMLADSEAWARCPDKQWDGVAFAGYLVWEHPAAEMGAKTVADRAKDAEAFLTEYNAWANGDGLGYDLVDEGDETVDSCGGFLEHDYMKRTIIDNLDPDDVVVDVEGPVDWNPSDFVRKAVVSC